MLIHLLRHLWCAVVCLQLAKTNRLNGIFNATSLQVRKIGDSEIAQVVGLVCLVQSALLAIFTGLPLSKPILAVGVGGLSEELVTSCSQESGFMSWFGGEIAFIACLMLPAGYLAFKTKDLPSQYNESAHISSALVLLLFFGVIIIPSARHASCTRKQQNAAAHYPSFLLSRFLTLLFARLFVCVC